MKAPPIVYYRVGRVERPCRDRQGRPSYRWTTGYSERADGGAPWVTRAEAIADARARGARATFRDPATS